MIIIPMGAPGSGKGTQARKLQEKLNITNISTGEIFRENIKNETELGKASQYYHDSGGLVPDNIVIDMVRDRLSREDCKIGFILDGFPRKVSQAEAFENILEELGYKIDYVIYIHLEKETILKRMRGRWSCTANDHVYHEVFNPPKTPGKCDIDGSDLYQREDQREEAIQERIKRFEEDIVPTIEYYRDREYFIEINGDQPIDKISREIQEKLGVH